MHDLLGEEIVKWAYAEGKIRAIFSAFGYAEIRMPALEKIEVFTHTVGDDTDIVQKQMYTLTDVGSEKLVLRPEGTASFIRAIIDTIAPHRSPATALLLSADVPLRATTEGTAAPVSPIRRGAHQRSRARGRCGAHYPARSCFPGFRPQGLRDPRDSVGCGDCRPAYKELLKDYFRPHLAQLCEQCQKRFERSPMRILDCKEKNAARSRSRPP